MLKNILKLNIELRYPLYSKENTVKICIDLILDHIWCVGPRSEFFQSVRFAFILKKGQKESVKKHVKTESRTLVPAL